MNKNTEILDKRLKMHIANMAIGGLPFGGFAEHSGAKILEDTLKKRGVVLSRKLHYEYKLPGGMNRSDFMHKLVMENFVNNFYSQYAGKILSDKNLTIKDKANVFKYVMNHRKKYKDILKQHEIEIKKLNPELANIKAGSSQVVVYGAMSGYAPAEIIYFSNGKNRDFSQEREITDLLKNRFGINITYVLAPETAKQIINALKQNEQVKAKER